LCQGFEVLPQRQAAPAPQVVQPGITAIHPRSPADKLDGLAGKGTLLGVHSLLVKPVTIAQSGDRQSRRVQRRKWGAILEIAPHSAQYHMCPPAMRGIQNTVQVPLEMSVNRPHPGIFLPDLVPQEHRHSSPFSLRIRLGLQASQQPVEQLAALRAIPNMWVMRPADANEVAQAYRVAMKRTDGPVAMILTRQKMPTFDRDKMAPVSGLAKGAYVLNEAAGGSPQVILIATGSEVALALAAQEKLGASGIRARVVSMPCWELFLEQTPEYRDSVIPRDVPARVSIEAGVSLGWHRWVGDRGVAIGLDRFGASGPGSVLVKQFGFTADNIVRAALSLVKT